ncbi:phage tail protein I [Clostridium chromiireducens]|uniref:Phage tail protein n=1 Tax=Clostridium chromiireducens TaxID=225345 RepID=A0A1V4IUS0_9CLOT|nr:phage tail protein I [Clostridium chromiireducens]OPJ63676.1 phage tail protein [Clostridium chromiireducens]
MINIYEASVLNLLPPNLQSDPDMIAASKAVDNEFLLIVNEVRNCILLPNLDLLPSDVVDLLAWQMHVDFYDNTLDLDVKRQLVRNSNKWHKQKGTPQAVEELISTVFDSGQVNEWFNYGGEPYTFQVITTNESVTIDRAEQFIRALNSVKNERSWLDKVVIEIGDEMNLYLAAIVHTGDFITISEVT